MATLTMGAAAVDGDAALLKKLLDAGGDVDERDNFGATPLHWACAHGNVDCVKLLMDANASVASTDSDLQTPLHFACRYGSDSKCVRLLLEARAELNAKDVKLRQPLHLACLKSNPASAMEIARVLLSAGAESDHKDKYGTSPRGCAEEREHVDLVKQLFKSKEEATSLAQAAPVAEVPTTAKSLTPSATAKLIQAIAGANAKDLQQAMLEATAAGVDDAVLIAAVQRLSQLQPPPPAEAAPPPAAAKPVTISLAAAVAVAALAIAVFAVKLRK